MVCDQTALPVGRLADQCGCRNNCTRRAGAHALICRRICRSTGVRPRRRSSARTSAAQQWAGMRQIGISAPQGQSQRARFVAGTIPFVGNLCGKIYIGSGQICSCQIRMWRTSRASRYALADPWPTGAASIYEGRPLAPARRKGTIGCGAPVDGPQYLGKSRWPTIVGKARFRGGGGLATGTARGRRELFCSLFVLVSGMRVACRLADSSRHGLARCLNCECAVRRIDDTFDGIGGDEWISGTRALAMATATI